MGTTDLLSQKSARDRSNGAARPDGNTLPPAASTLRGKNRYPTADAQLALGFLNLYEACQAQDAQDEDQTDDRSTAVWLKKAKDLANELLKQSSPGYKGFCWGYPFDWQHVNGLMPKGTPHITATPYCYEVFTRLFDLTGDAHYLDIAQSISTFVSEDLKDSPVGDGAAASSYTPYDQGKVVNASAYRAFVLFDAARRFHNQEYFTKAQRNLRFVLESQGTDGSWLYAIDNPPEAFIDNFHTCFVLKNLYKLNKHLGSPDVTAKRPQGLRVLSSWLCSTSRTIRRLTPSRHVPR